METTSPRFNSNAASIFQFSPPLWEARIRTRKEARLRVAGFGGPM